MYPLISGAAIIAFLLTASTLGAEPKESSAVSAPPRELRITSQMPPGSMQTNNLTLFKERVETASKGALTISIFPSAQLVADDKVIEAVVAGQVEMGGSRIGHFTEAVPALGIFLLPFMFNVPALEVGAMQAGSPVRRPLDQAVLEKTGARVLWWQPFGNFVLLSKTVPVTTPADIAGKTVRVFDKNTSELVKACGGTPIYLSANEHYEAYKTGRAEIGQAPLPTIVSRKIWEVMDTLTNTRHLTDAMLIIINEQVWQSLSADHRRILEEAAAEAQRAISADLRKIEIESYALVAKHGMKVVEVSNEQVLEWKACSTPLVEGYVERSGRLGAKALAAYRKILVEIYRTPAPAQMRQ